jgi:hypothetical protein
MMKRFLLLIMFLLPTFVMAQKNQENSCSPVIGGKICYTDEVEMTGTSCEIIYDNINRWAAERFGKDIFLSNVTTDKDHNSFFIHSKMELMLDEKQKTMIKFDLNIACFNEKYSASITNIVYEYDPANGTDYKTFPAEHVIGNQGKDNTLNFVKDPVLFCNATLFFANNIFNELMDGAQENN